MKAPPAIVVEEDALPAVNGPKRHIDDATSWTTRSNRESMSGIVSGIVLLGLAGSVSMSVGWEQAANIG